ncbi:MAG: class E sortase [Jatrophihabitans sp.]
MSELSKGGWDFSDSAAAPVGQLDQLLTGADSDLDSSGPVAGAGGGRRRPPPTPTTAVGGPRYGGGGARRGTADSIRMALRGLGQTLITVGLVLLLFVVYEVWVSNYFADRKQNQIRHEYANAIKQGQDPLKGEDRLNLPIGKQVVLPAGQGFANLYIPQFGKDFVKTVVQGTDDAALDRGPGHYVNSQVPGQIGNFAVAGHRVGKGEPFLNLDQLHPGDKIVVQTATNWYVYTVLGDQNAYAAALKIGNAGQRSAAVTASLAAVDGQGVPGREIVSPGAVQVIAPVPDHPSVTPTRALLTLTTCHPKYTANQRMIIHAVLSRAVPIEGSALPKELPGGTL